MKDIAAKPTISSVGRANEIQGLEVIAEINETSIKCSSSLFTFHNNIRPQIKRSTSDQLML